MLLTFAELEFLLSLADGEPALSLLDLLEHPVDQRLDSDALIAAGLASLVARGGCRVVDHDGAESADGVDTSDGTADGTEAATPAATEVVELDAELVALHAAIHGATTAIRVDTVSPGRSACWVLLAGAGRAAFTTAGPGVYAAVVMPHDVELRQQAISLVTSALVDDPGAGVAISRTSASDALVMPEGARGEVPWPEVPSLRMSFRTNDELGGARAPEGIRRIAVVDLVDDVFARDHPSRG